MSGISTHVLDTSRGTPAAGVGITLDRRTATGAWETLATTATDLDGRGKSLLPVGTALAVATYRLRFDTAGYFAASGVRAFFPSVEVVFAVDDAARHHHVPLLLSPFGYSTYRGT